MSDVDPVHGGAGIPGGQDPGTNVGVVVQPGHDHGVVRCQDASRASVTGSSAAWWSWRRTRSAPAGRQQGRRRHHVRPGPVHRSPRWPRTHRWRWRSPCGRLADRLDHRVGNLGSARSIGEYDGSSVLGSGQGREAGSQRGDVSALLMRITRADRPWATTRRPVEEREVVRRCGSGSISRSTSSPWDQLVSRARMAEDAGLDGVWVFDHFTALYADPMGPCLEGWTLLAGLARETSRIRLGTLVTGMTHRHPSVLATQVVTVDHLSKAGSNARSVPLGTSQSTGSSASRSRRRRSAADRLEEGVQVLRARCSRRTTSSFEGRYFRLGRRDVPSAADPAAEPSDLGRVATAGGGPCPSQGATPTHGTGGPTTGRAG